MMYSSEIMKSFPPDWVLLSKKYCNFCKLKVMHNDGSLTDDVNTRNPSTTYLQAINNLQLFLRAVFELN